jgi:hypothetical protein
MATDPTTDPPVPELVEIPEQQGKKGKLGGNPPYEAFVPQPPGGVASGITQVSPVPPVALDPDIADWAAGLDDDAREFFNERAGIREFDGGMSRQDAEAEAQKDVLRWLSRRR